MLGMVSTCKKGKRICSALGFGCLVGSFHYSSSCDMWQWIGDSEINFTVTALREIIDRFSE